MELIKTEDKFEFSSSPAHVKKSAWRGEDQASYKVWVVTGHSSFRSTRLYLRETALEVTSVWVPQERCKLDQWELIQGFIVEYHRESGDVIAVPRLETVDEYGIGKSEEEALDDLISSLAEYREVLEKHEGTWAERETSELESLRGLIKRRA